MKCLSPSESQQVIFLFASLLRSDPEGVTQKLNREIALEPFDLTLKRIDIQSRYPRNPQEASVFDHMHLPLDTDPAA